MDTQEDNVLKGAQANTGEASRCVEIGTMAGEWEGVVEVLSPRYGRSIQSIKERTKLGRLI